MSSGPCRVVIAGAGVAGLEALLVLHALAEKFVATTVLAPEPTFVMGAASVGTPFGHGPPPQHDVAAIVAAHGAEFVRGELRRVHRDDRQAIAADGDRLAFDALLVAVGARPEAAYREALTFRGAGDVQLVMDTLRELEAGRVASLAFVVPPGTTWPLPLYELALLTAAHAELHDLAVDITLVTPEAAPLTVLGDDVARHAAERLAEAGVAVLSRTQVEAIAPGGALLGPGRTEIARPERTIALARLHGPAVDGLPQDDDGFLPVDDAGRVGGLDAIYAAGDAVASELKHGGLSAQQAERTAHEIARGAGAPVAAHRPAPILRAELLEGAGRTFLRRRGAAGPAVLAQEALWWPPLKVVAPRLATYLAEHGAGP